MERQIQWIGEHLEHGAERLKVFQVSLVELLQARYQERGSRLQRLKEAVSSPEHMHPHQVPVFLTHSRREQVLPPEVRRPVHRPLVASLFIGVPLDMCQTIYDDILRPDLVGARLLRWEADLVFPIWLPAWVQWHASLLPLLSGSRDADLHAHLPRVDTRAFAFSQPTQVAVEPQGSVGWHVDFLLRDRTKFHSLWPGDVIHLCGSSFNWAHGLPLLEVLMASSAVRLDSVIARARRGTGSVHLIYGSEAQTRAGLAKAEADSSAAGLIVCCKKGR